jgi:hypothetical protein
MKIVIDGPASDVAVVEAEELTQLSVELRACSTEQATHLLGDLGRVEGEHAWLSIDTLRAAGPTRSCGWDARFAKAMAYAREKGWTDSTGDFVRAHIESIDVQA